MTRDTITLQQGCQASGEKTLRWEDIRYVVFDSNCSGSGTLDGGFGRNDDLGNCGKKERFLRIDFNHASDEPFIYARSIQTVENGLVRIDTARKGVVSGPRTRVKSIAVAWKCSSDPLLGKGSLPREYR